jgi:AcrR family transcriptional regulator
LATASSDDSDIPRSLQLLWGRVDRRPRGPQQALSLERIVAAAIEIADADGIQALSMARLAERLGCATMSLYRHVANKDELQVFMMDAGPGEPPIIEVAPHDWRGGLERWARELRTVYYRHPWVLQITTDRPPLEPGQLAWLECGLRTLGGTRLSPDDKLSVLLMLVNYILDGVEVLVCA